MAEAASSTLARSPPGEDASCCRGRTAQSELLACLTWTWVCSSDGRALHSHCRGREFNSPQIHRRLKRRTAAGGPIGSAASRFDPWLVSSGTIAQLGERSACTRKMAVRLCLVPLDRMLDGITLFKSVTRHRPLQGLLYGGSPSGGCLIVPCRASALKESMEIHLKSLSYSVRAATP